MVHEHYYNEIDPFAAATLRNLIAAGHIAPGIVDERSIEDVQPAELARYTQCHFFAGIGVWSYALRLAGWPDDRPVWTGSCPCQPFSTAGQGAGFADERHLWPAWLHLIGQRRPATILGEQVASKDADAWVDLVHDDMEALDYAFGAVPFPSAGVGAPHIRDRMYWCATSVAGRHLGADRGTVAVGHTKRAGLERLARHGHDGYQPGWLDTDAAGSVAEASCFGRLAHPDRSPGRQGRPDVPRRADGSDAEPRPGLGGERLPCGLADNNHDGRSPLPVAQRDNAEHHAEPRGESGGLANANGQRPPGDAGSISGVSEWPHRVGSGRVPADGYAGPTNGLWRAADWLLCRDGRWRPVEPGTFPLAHGSAARVGRLRAYGNAINAEAARVFIESVKDHL